jgi:hypothetical protein
LRRSAQPPSIIIAAARPSHVVRSERPPPVVGFVVGAAPPSADALPLASPEEPDWPSVDASTVTPPSLGAGAGVGAGVGLVSGVGISAGGTSAVGRLPGSAPSLLPVSTMAVGGANVGLTGSVGTLLAVAKTESLVASALGITLSPVACALGAPAPGCDVVTASGAPAVPTAAGTLPDWSPTGVVVAFGSTGPCILRSGCATAPPAGPVPG